MEYYTWSSDGEDWSFVIHAFSKALWEVDDALHAMRDTVMLDATEYAELGALATADFYIYVNSEVAKQTTDLIYDVVFDAITPLVYIQTLVDYTQTLLNVIYYDVVIQMQDLSVLLRADYQEIIVELHDALMFLSKEMGLRKNAFGDQLLLARRLVVDVATMAGKNFDLAELEWFHRCMRFLSDFSYLSEKTWWSERKLSIHIMQYFDVPYLDAKARMHLDQAALIRGLATGLEELANRVLVSETAGEPPLSPQEQYFRDRTEERLVFLEHDWWQKRRFTWPEHGKLHQDTKAAMDNRLTSMEVKIDLLTEMILKPGDYLKTVDLLKDEDRLQQESIIAEVATRAYNTVTEEINKDIDDDLKVAEADFDKIVSA